MRSSSSSPSRLQGDRVFYGDNVSGHLIPCCQGPFLVGIGMELGRLQVTDKWSPVTCRPRKSVPHSPAQETLAVGVLRANLRDCSTLRTFVQPKASKN